MPLDVQELVPLALLLLGLIPIVAAAYHNEALKWTTAAYTALVIGGIATVAEHLTFPTLLNYVEHGIGVGLAGLLFGATAYINSSHTKSIKTEIADKIEEVEDGG